MEKGGILSNWGWEKLFGMELFISLVVMGVAWGIQTNAMENIKADVIETKTEYKELQSYVMQINEKTAYINNQLSTLIANQQNFKEKMEEMSDLQKENARARDTK